MDQGWRSSVNRGSEKGLCGHLGKQKKSISDKMLDNHMLYEEIQGISKNCIT